MSRKRVAIVGAGFSGAVLAAQLLKRGVNVVLIERGRDFGRGMAYAAKDSVHLLNVRASNMSAFPDQPDHFAKWLGKRGDGASFQPRALYGSYVQDVLRDAGKGRWLSGVKRVHDEVVACRAADDGWALTLASGNTMRADAVVLALGNAASEPPLAFARAGVPMLGPWDVGAQARIQSSADVLIVGTGLTMIDVVLSLSKKPRKGVITAVSRRGLVPHAHPTGAHHGAKDSLNLPPQLSDAVRLMRIEAKALAAHGEPWTGVLDRIRAKTPELWMKLPEAAQQRFLRHLRPYWDIHRHRAAPEVAARIAELRRSGKLRVIAGEIQNVERLRRGLAVNVRPRGKRDVERIEAAAAINCSGASQDFARSHDKLVRQLIDEGVARVHASGIGFDVGADNRVASRMHGAQASLFAIGPITQGSFWESTAVPELRVRAAQIADAVSAKG